jgi:hypothetical protein
VFLIDFIVHLFFIIGINFNGKNDFIIKMNFVNIGYSSGKLALTLSVSGLPLITNKAIVNQGSKSSSV